MAQRPRSHAEIVKDYGATRLQARLVEQGFVLARGAAQLWVQRDSIPKDYWAALAEDGIATLTELAVGADPRNQPATV